MPSLSDSDVIEAVRLSMGRSATVVHRELKRGLNTLASVAATAPLIGFFGTCQGIFGRFRGISGERTAAMLCTLLELSRALAPTALSLMVAIPAFMYYRYLTSQVEVFDVEIQNASSEVMSYVTLQLRQGNR